MNHGALDMYSVGSYQVINSNDAFNKNKSKNTSTYTFYIYKCWKNEMENNFSLSHLFYRKRNTMRMGSDTYICIM